MKKVFLTFILAASSIVTSAQWYANTAPGVTINASLEGRGVSLLPRPSCSIQQSGAVVVTVWVDNYGKVVKAQAGADGTTITDKALWDATRKVAMGTRFKLDIDAPAMQQGTITYVFSTPEEDLNAPARPGVIKFMDLPVDGNRRALESALEKKGFSREYRSQEEMNGIFNGESIELIISTNHDVVDRIQIKYPRLQQEELVIKFNNLISRYGRTNKYVTLRDNRPIPESEDVYDGIYLKKKRYDAIYYYLEPDVDAAEWKASFMREYNQRYSKDLQTLSQEEVEEIMFCLPEEIVNSISGVVWFYLPDANHLEIFYDNMKNRPHGEDL